MRADMVDNGVKFLRHPNVQATPLSERVSFLEQKGLTKEEIQEAIERYQSDDGSGGSAAPLPAAVGMQSPASVVAGAAPMVAAAAAPVQQLLRHRARMPRYLRVLLTVSSVVGAATILGFMWSYMAHSGFFPWLRWSRPLLEAPKDDDEQQAEEEEKEKKLLSSLEDVSTAIQTQTQELSKLCSTLEKQEEKLHTAQLVTKHVPSLVAEQATMQAIAELKAEVSTLKSLLVANSSQPNSTSLKADAASLETKAATPQEARESVGLAASTTVAAPVRRETAAQKMEAILKKFRQDNSVEKLKLASSILIMYVKNLVENPDVPRYRRIAPANANFKQKIEPLQHHAELLKAIGFESTGLNMEWKWHTLNRSNGEFDEHLAVLRALLKALQALASSASDDPIALEEIAHASMQAFYASRAATPPAESVRASTDAATKPQAAPLSLGLSPAASDAEKQRETDLAAFIDRLKEKTKAPALPVAAENDVDLEDKAPVPDSSAATDSSAASSDGPAYPKSFLEVMEMVKKGEKVPGIQDIEDRVSDDAAKFLEEHAAAADAKPKPWEKKATPAAAR
ncbi:hypothetical protein ATCC90586_009355 [Pythium insidiosum]|nr:hypothetical protein ATCC90586_009355 [Pythium insidiosum]